MVYVSEQMIFDFSETAAGEGWRVVDDVVMGGCSRSRIEAGKGTLVFAGELSLEQGGGFASIRSPDCRVNISSGTSLLLCARGDGHRYKLGLRLSRGFDAPVYQAAFCPPIDDFALVQIPYHQLQPHYHGRLLADAAPFDPRTVSSFGLLIADRQAGSFRLELRSLACR